VGRAEYKVEGGKLIKVQLEKSGNAIGKIKIMGDFFLHPEELIEEVERTLEGRPLNEADLIKHLKTLIEENEATLLGASSVDFARCIVMAGDDDD
jgi:lipoate-protein ligase A